MGFWLKWLGRLIAVVSLFKLASAVFNLGLSAVLKNAVALYEQTIYPLISPIVYVLHYFNLNFDKDILVICFLTMGLMLRSFMMKYYLAPLVLNVFMLAIMFFMIIYASTFSILLSVALWPMNLAFLYIFFSATGDKTAVAVREILEEYAALFAAVSVVVGLNYALQ